MFGKRKNTHTETFSVQTGAEMMGQEGTDEQFSAFSAALSELIKKYSLKPSHEGRYAKDMYRAAVKKILSWFGVEVGNLVKIANQIDPNQDGLTKQTWNKKSMAALVARLSVFGEKKYRDAFIESVSSSVSSIQEKRGSYRELVASASRPVKGDDVYTITYQADTQE